jgi:sugar phosphate isomerase/epimerase
MDKLVLGASTWTFNGLLPQELRTIVDGSGDYPREQMHAVQAYFVELATALAHSEIKAVQLWYSSVFTEGVVLEQLLRLSSAQIIHSMHAPFGSDLDLSSPTEHVRSAGVTACCHAAALVHRLGGSALVVHGSAHIGGLDKHSRAENSARSIAEIADRCAESGVQIGVELMPGTDFVGGNATQLLLLLDSIGRPNVGAWLDVNHVFPPDLLIPTVHALGRRILGLHIADYDGLEDKHWLPTRGIIDWPRLIDELIHVGYAGPFTYEARFEALDLDEAVEILTENFGSLMAGR